MPSDPGTLVWTDCGRHWKVCLNTCENPHSAEMGRTGGRAEVRLGFPLLVPASNSEELKD